MLDGSMDEIPVACSSCIEVSLVRLLMVAVAGALIAVIGEHFISYLKAGNNWPTALKLEQVAIALSFRIVLVVLIIYVLHAVGAVIVESTALIVGVSTPTALIALAGASFTKVEPSAAEASTSSTNNGNGSSQEFEVDLLAIEAAEARQESEETPSPEGDVADK